MKAKLHILDVHEFGLFMNILFYTCTGRPYMVYSSLGFGASIHEQYKSDICSITCTSQVCEVTVSYDEVLL